MIRLTWNDRWLTGHLELCGKCTALLARIFRQLGVQLWVENGNYQKCQRCWALYGDLYGMKEAS